MAYFTDLLEEAGLSKSDLAQFLGVQKSTISSWKESPPQYVIWGLQNYIDSMDCKGLKLYFKKIMK